MIALGLVAAPLRSGCDSTAERAARSGRRARGPRGQPRGGARRRRVPHVGRRGSRALADDAPAVPIALVPEATRLTTAAARAALPDDVAHGDAAFTAAHAALLGAALARAHAELFAAALADRLHEPYRAADAPLLAASARGASRLGAVGATLSGSGPTVIVWARRALGARVRAGARSAASPMSPS